MRERVSNNGITLKGVSLSSLTAQNFSFVTGSPASAETVAIKCRKATKVRPLRKVGGGRSGGSPLRFFYQSLAVATGPKRFL
jgi:hypothetical protein